MYRYRRPAFFERIKPYATVIDTEPLLQAHFAQLCLSLDVGPYDGQPLQRNALGMRLVTQTAAAALMQPEQLVINRPGARATPAG